MASGQNVLKIFEPMPPGATAAYQTAVAGGSTPPESALPFAFVDALSRYMDWKVRLINYGGAGLTFRLAHDTQTGTAGNNARIGLALRRMQNNTTSLSSSLTYVYTTNDLATPSSRTRWMYSDVAVTNGANMDNMADGDYGILRVFRDGGHANDTISGIWLLHGISAVET